MMQAMRNPKLYKWGLYALLVLTIPAFVLFYGTPGGGMGGGGPQISDIEDAVTVQAPSGRMNLSLTYVQDAERELINQYARVLALQFGVDPNSPQGQQFIAQRAGQLQQVVTLKDAAEFAVGKAAYDDLALRSGLRITSELVERDLQDSGVTADQWNNMVAQSRMSERQLLELMKADLQRTRIRGLVGNTARVSLLETWLQHRLQNDLLTVEYAAFNASDYSEGVELTDEEIRTYFNENADQYIQPELITVDYIVVRPPSAEVAAPTEEEILAYYEAVDPAQDSRFRQAEGRRVRHIMIETGGDSALTADEARALAEEARNRIVNEGEDFAQIANQYSTDILNFGQVSATEAGPQLLGGLIERLVTEEDREFLEQSYGPTWYEEVTGLPQGEVSPVFEGEGAFYVAVVEEEIPEGKRPLAEVRSIITSAIRTERQADQETARREQFAETRQSLRIAREEVATLEGIAAEAGVEVQSTPPIDSERRLFDLIEYTGNLFQYRDYLNGLREGVISDVLPASGPEGLQPLVILEITEVMEERPMSFEEARDQATEDLRRERALELAKTDAEQLMELASGSDSLTSAAVDMDVEVTAVEEPFSRFSPPAPLTQVRSDLAQKSFSADAGDVLLTEASSTQMSSGGTPVTRTSAFYVVRLTTLEEPDQFEFVETMGNTESQLRVGKTLSFLEEFRIDALDKFNPQYNEEVFAEVETEG